MKSQVVNTPENKRSSAAKAVSAKQNNGGATFQFVDNRTEAVAQRKIQTLANNSLRFQHPVQMMRQSPALAQPSLQLKGREGNANVSIETGTAQTGGQAAQVVQLTNKKAKNKRRHQRAEKEKQRVAAIDRLERGGPSDYSHMDPMVAQNLQAIDAQQPRKSAARKNIDGRAARLKEAAPPSVLEVGAGEGRFSKAFAGKFGRNYMATDIAAQEGPNGFLRASKKAGVRTQFGVDANQIGGSFKKGSLNHIVGANPFGMKGVGGASYGLSRENPQGVGKNKWLPDQRFLSSARPLLKPGGSVELYGRSNMLREAAVARVPKTGKGGTRTQAEQARVGAAKAKFKGENANPYLTISPQDLHAIAKATKYKVRVKRAKQPGNIGKGGNPDTRDKDIHRAEKGLKPFNTRFSFRPEEDGYDSDNDGPRVTYSDGRASDWEDD
jgi:hypothetical protein